MDEFFEAMSQSSFGVAIRERAEARGRLRGRPQHDAICLRDFGGRVLRRN